jgi:hypothetical protein
MEEKEFQTIHFLELDDAGFLLLCRAKSQQFPLA